MTPHTDGGHYADVLGAALAYAVRGWPVHALSGKAATLRDWPNAASTDAALIRTWWAERPGANVGVVTGPRSGLAVLDIDPRNGGAESLATLRRVIDVPRTLAVRTGSGGLHLIYAHPGRPVACGANALGKGLDVKADGGYVVAAPSVHPDTGARYEWLNRDDPAPWPLAFDEVRAAMAAEREAARRARYSGAVAAAGCGTGVLALARWVEDLQPGRRNAGLFWAACRAYERGATNLGPLYRAAMDAGLSAFEAERTIASAERTVGGAA
jgi:hypothetical protein